MRCTWTLLLLIAVSGCLSGTTQFGPAAPPVAIYFENPMLVTCNDPQYVWETMTNVVRDYFRLEREEPCRVVGATITEGRLDTFPGRPARPASSRGGTIRPTRMRSSRARCNRSVAVPWSG